MKPILFMLLLVMASFAESKAVWITLSGDVDQGMADYAERAIQEAVNQKPDVIVFEINTFGGLLSAAFDIVDTITAIRGIPTVAYVTEKAISAGALIALSCNRLYMKPSTTIGDCAPILQSQEGPQILGEKIQSPLRAKFRNLAQRNGYPELLSESMVTPELEVVRVQKGDSIRYLEAKEYEELSEEEQEAWGPKKTVVREGELLTLTDVEALQMKFSQKTVPTEAELLQELKADLSIRVEITWAEKLASFIVGISPILMMIAFGALYMEFQAPGFGLFGIVGIALLGIVFGGQYVGGLADQLPLVLLILGMVLFVVEIFFFPGTWIAGIAGLGLIIAALILVFKESTVPVPTGFDWGFGTEGLQRALLMVLGSALGALLIPVLASRYLLPRLPSSMSPMLAEGLEAAHSPHEDSAKIHVGDVGVVVTILKPMGKARFDHLVLEVYSAQGMIEAGVNVRVLSVNGTHIIVTEIPKEAK